MSRSSVRLPPLSLNARFRWDVIRRVIAERSPESVLEFGAGKGAMGARLAAGAAYVGVEPDPQSRAAAVSAVESSHGSVVPAPTDIDPTARFDMVCAFEVLEHIEDDLDALRTWQGMLAEHGFVLLSVPAHRSRFGPSDVRVGHFRRYDRDDLEQLAQHAGLTIDRIWSTGWPVGIVLEWVWNLVAKLRPSDAGVEMRSSESGRWFQPSRLVAPLWSVVSVPSVRLQRVRFGTDAGTGWVVLCTKA